MPLFSTAKHSTSHETGGIDAITGNLDANARVTAKKNGTFVGSRRNLNLLEGVNTTITVADDSVNEAVNVTIAAVTSNVSVVNSQSGTAYTLQISDADRIVESTSSSNFTLTIPADATTNFPTGSVIELFRYGTGEYIVAGAVGVCRRARDRARHGRHCAGERIAAER